MTGADLIALKCEPQTEALSSSDIAGYMNAIPDWALQAEQQIERLVRVFSFGDYQRTMAFVDAVAELAHDQDHHPELLVTYSRCVVRYNTHSVNAGRGGLSLNDFICAAKADRIYDATRPSQN